MPGIVPARSFVRQAAHLIDVMPTCLELAGTEYRGALRLDGSSLMPLLRGQAGPIDRELYWEVEGNCAVRKGKWKLVKWNPKPWELYDLEADRCELNDLAAKNPAKVRELAARFGEITKQNGVRPWDKPPYELKA
jgi:arylsulfatase